jgi:hypothetical protein
MKMVASLRATGLPWLDGLPVRLILFAQLTLRKGLPITSMVLNGRQPGT